MFVDTITAAAPTHLPCDPSAAASEGVVEQAAHRALAECHKLHRQLESVVPQWFDLLDQHDLLLCTDEELDALQGSAPGDFMSGYVFSWFSSRATLATMTQRTLSSSFAGEGREMAMEKLRSESLAHDGWFASLDLIDPDTCTKDELLEILASAPSPFTRGYLYGKVTMRVEMSALTGRHF